MSGPQHVLGVAGYAAGMFARSARVLRRLRPAWWWGLLLSATAVAAPLLTPDRRGIAAPDRTFDLQRLVLDLNIDPFAHALAGSANFTVSRLAPGPLVLDQVALNITTVTVGGRPVPWYTRGDTLVIGLPDGADPLTVTVTYSASPDNGLHFRDASPTRYAEVWSHGEPDDHRHWFPGWDHPNDRFVYEGRYTLPPGWSVLTNSGQEVVNYLVMVAAGPYTKVGTPDNEVWAPPGVSAEAVERIRAPIPAIKQRIEARTGRAYPWDSYRQVLVQGFMYTGMENTSATVMDLLVAAPNRSWETRATRNLAVVAHELAHQWFGDLLTCRSFRELWLNEGFATFFELDWSSTVEGPEYGAFMARSQYQQSLGPSVLAARFHQGVGTPESSRVYVKGASVLQMLRVMLGEDTFWRGIRTYVAQNAHQLVETIDLQRAMESVSGRELGWFFQQWVELPYVPELTVEDRYEGGELRVTVTQKLSDSQPAYTLPVTVTVVRGSERQTRTAWLEDAKMELRFSIAGPPDYVAFDPYGGLLAKVEQRQDPAAWEAQLADPGPFVRLRAIERLGLTDRSDALARVLGDRSTSRWYRVAAAAALGEQRAAAPLLAGLGDPDARVRLAVASALGRIHTVAPAGAVRSAYRAEKNPDVQGELLAALSAMDPSQAVGLSRAVLADRDQSRSVDGTRIVAAAAAVLGRHGEMPDIPKLLAVDGVHRMRVDGARGAVGIAARQTEPREKERAQVQVRPALERLLEDDDRRVREAGVELLGALGDPRAVTALERFRREDTGKDTSASVDRALETLRKASPPPPGLPDDARVEALEKTLRALDERLDRLETTH